MPWHYRQYGAPLSPIHKSHLNAITGDYGCPAQFRYTMDERADRGESLDERDTVSGKAAAGTAAHETIARALGKPALVEQLLAGKGGVTREQVAVVFEQEFTREVGQRTVQWYDDKSTSERGSDLLAERVDMIVGLLADLHKYVAKVELVEAGFVAPLGDYWLSGHIDLVYRPRQAPETIALADWKTGASKPVAIELDHGWEAGVYSTALARGFFLPRERIAVSSEPDGRTTATLGKHSVTHWSRYIAEREALERALVDIAVATAARAPLDDSGDAPPLCFAEFPSRIYHVHLADYVPYKKAGAKAVKRPEDLAHYGYDKPVARHKYVAGDRRGPAWLPVALASYDLPRLETRLRNVVGMIRMGRFIDQVGERCTRCAYAKSCLTSGYAPRGDERKTLERSLRVVPDVDVEQLSIDD